MYDNETPLDRLRNHGLQYIHRGETASLQIVAQLADEVLGSRGSDGRGDLLQLMDRLRWDLVLLTRNTRDSGYRDQAVRRCAQIGAVLVRKLQHQRTVLDVRNEEGHA